MYLSCNFCSKPVVPLQMQQRRLYTTGGYGQNPNTVKVIMKGLVCWWCNFWWNYWINRVVFSYNLRGQLLLCCEILFFMHFIYLRHDHHVYLTFLDWLNSVCTCQLQLYCNLGQVLLKLLANGAFLSSVWVVLVWYRIYMYYNIILSLRLNYSFLKIFSYTELLLCVRLWLYYIMITSNHIYCRWQYVMSVGSLYLDVHSVWRIWVQHPVY